ncbi:MAG: lipoyl(octanoyl) transferase LipB, partial [Thermodesulfobacteriota bacterium]|nr:lipoyl(octanoyl) transferase LipB [Thermodesulfobacteriota bacterium]
SQLAVLNANYIKESLKNDLFLPYDRPCMHECVFTDKNQSEYKENVILMVEHPPVFTVGKRGGKENLVKSETFLKAENMPVIQTGRGGNITFHGPGQLVAYPIVNLRQAGKGIPEFVYLLESVMIEIAAGFKVKADRDKRNHGIWVDKKKIGSVGLTIRRNISFHGLALNVNMDLAPFSWIHPCGMPGVEMTSIEKEVLKSGINVSVTMEKAKQKMSECFENLEIN